MTLLDTVCDEAEELATNRILGDNPTDAEIISHLREVTRCNFSIYSTAAKFGIASYRRMENAVKNMQSVLA